MNIQDILETLSAAHQAVQELPQVKAALTEKTEAHDRLLDDNRALQEQIDNLHTQISLLNEKVRSMEVERDEAHFRELEAQEKFTNLLGKVRSTLGDLGEAVAELSSEAPTPVEPKPEPIPEVTAPTPEAEAEAEASPKATEPNPTMVEPEPASAGAGLSSGFIKPYDGWSRWRKPDGVSWQEFVAGGGEQPLWLSDLAPARS